MRTFNISAVLALIFLTYGCGHSPMTAQAPDNTESSPSLEIESLREAITLEHLENGAWTHPLYSQEWQSAIDKGLEKDPTFAYLWQQKAMPLFKQGKYEAGMEYIDKAVEYDEEEYLEYRAFIKCIFAKTYRDAIEDFQLCKQKYGNRFVMDHTYDFHIALSHLQLNEFEKAEQIFRADMDSIMSAKGEDWLHPLDMFYFGVSLYEQGEYEEAEQKLDLALTLYPEFSDAQYYKAIVLSKTGRKEEAKALYASAIENGEEGYTINEDNEIYERYPYQVRW